MLNINGSTDPSYRYKMPRVVGKVEGRGNGIKTVIVNCREVASSLKRPTEQLTKFIGLQMGASSRIEHDKSIVNGAIDTADLQKLITVYIEKFVLCPKCGNPETVQKLAASGAGGKKSTVVVLKCKACGETTDADNSHRLITLIVKELTDNGAKEKKSSSDKKKDEVVISGLKNNTDAQNEATAAADEENTKAMKKPKKDKKKSSPSKKSSSVDKQALKQAAERISARLDFLTAQEGETVDGDAIVEEATALCKELGLDVKDSLVQVVWRATVSSRNAKPSSSVEQFASVLSAVAREGKKNPARILKCAADYSGEDEKVIKSIPLAVKALYDTDVCTEEDILQWFEKAKLDSRVKKTLQPLIEWLEADDESSEEEEEEEEESSEEEEEEQGKKRSNSTSSDNSSANSSDED